MTEKEAVRLVAIAAANFPALQDKDLRPTALLWHRALGDLTYAEAEAALYKVLCTARNFPTVAQIREAAAELRHGRQLTAAEAWDLVARAMERYGYYREQEALASLPPDVAALVRRFGWREMCACEDLGVLRGQFRHAWEELITRRREEIALPALVRELIERAAAALPGKVGD